jgi:hypothetical protein
MKSIASAARWDAQGELFHYSRCRIGPICQRYGLIRKVKVSFGFVIMIGVVFISSM